MAVLHGESVPRSENLNLLKNDFFLRLKVHLQLIRINYTNILHPLHPLATPMATTQWQWRH